MVSYPVSVSSSKSVCLSDNQSPDVLVPFIHPSICVCVCVHVRACMCSFVYLLGVYVCVCMCVRLCVLGREKGCGTTFACYKVTVPPNGRKRGDCPKEPHLITPKNIPKGSCKNFCDLFWYCTLGSIDAIVRFVFPSMFKAIHDHLMLTILCLERILPTDSNLQIHILCLNHATPQDDN